MISSSIDTVQREVGSESTSRPRVWSSDAYLRYVRTRKAQLLRLAQAACSTDVDDLENEFLAIELDPDLNAFADSDDED